ncbi:TonB-dependent receptor [Rhodocytophaga aerolata]|uniref:TonB-dependent receptor n=1 Tax=Rhodocytophaga aerolata TaxID=455078 RepID=A0ABT8R2A0_9BACT|nr:TonB-dependent receptor [Rhodocytophaga aerolata]MDO1444912.1 TonB-dependent receptor [Rhodocytophaga aerolata]
MMKLFTCLCLYFLLCCISKGVAQGEEGTITGKIVAAKVPVAFANVVLKDTQIGTTTSEKGEFTLKAKPGNYVLQASAVGYTAFQKTIVIQPGETHKIDITMQESSINLGEVVVTGTMKETFVKDSPVKVEVITQKFLLTNPTNNVIEAIQTVNGVQEQINCGVCGTNDIHINGMEGPYTLVLIDGMPIVSSLATVYGFNGIPTSLVDRIEIIKGPSSTLYGTEAVGGVINIITRKPDKMPWLSFNTFYTTHHEWNTDLAFSPRISKNIATTFSANYYRNQYRLDNNGDNFTDIPLNERVSLFTKWHFTRKNNYLASIAARYYGENRFGGTMQWQPIHRGSNQVYGESIYTKRFELIGSYQLPVSFTNLKIDYSFNIHNQNSFYGKTPYKADQKVYFTNLLWNHTFGNHDLLVGGTLRYQTYADNSLASTNDKRFIPGIFAQNEWKFAPKSSLLVGARLDHHQKHGFIFAPRINLKQGFGDFTTARLNLGTGFRVVNLFTEDHAALTGARTVLIQNDLQPEESYNATLNLNRVYTLGESAGSVDVDLFYTYFTNKIIPDYDTDPNLIIYDNLEGHGISRGVAMNVQHSFLFPLRITMGATLQDVYEITKDETGKKYKETQAFTPRLSGTFVIGYEFKKARLSIDYTGRVMGSQRLPEYTEPFTRPTQSPWYTIQNVQINKEWKKGFQLYGGVKNLWNYTQNSPLIDPANPFGDSFDTSYAWGPLQTRRFYLGVRWNIQ